MTQPIGIRELRTQLNTYYLGVQGAMRALRIPDAGVTCSTSRSEVVHQLISGGTAATRRDRARRNWQLGFGGTTPDTASLLTAFYQGSFGDGPFCFVDPAWRNALSFEASTFGVRVQAISAWSTSVTGNPLSYDTTVTPPVVGSGVARWAGAQNTNRVGLGVWTGFVFTPSATFAPPYLPAVVTTLSVYARAVSGTPSLSLRGLVVDATGTALSTTTTTVTLSSSFQRVTVTAPASVANGVYVVPDLLCNTNSSVINFAGADVQYTAATPTPAWVPGFGIARVVIGAGIGGSSLLYISRDHTLTLLEI